MKNYNIWHFIGIGGVSMRALAENLKQHNKTVTGTNLVPLNLKDIEVFIQDDKSHIPHNTEIVVYNTDIKENHPEIIYAKEHNIPLIHRVELLNMITNELGFKIAVTGSSGKTSTTNYLYELMINLNYDPSVFIGEITLNGSTYKIGNDKIVIAELNEADMMYGEENADSIIFQNFGLDHYWNFDSDPLEAKKKLKFYYDRLLSKVKNIFYYKDDHNVKEIVQNINNVNKIAYGELPYGQFSYGFKDCDFTIIDIEDKIEGVEFKFQYKNEIYNVKTQLNGVFSAINIMSAIACLHISLNISLSDLCSVTNKINHPSRRFETIFQNNKLTIIEDQALYPKEIIASINGAKKYNKTIHLVVDPFRKQRVDAFLEEYHEIIKDYRVLSPYEDLVINSNHFHMKTDEDFIDFVNNSEGILFLFYKSVGLGKYKSLVNSNFN